MLIKPNSQFLAAWFLIIGNLVLVREIGRGGLGTAIGKLLKSAQIFAHPLTWFKVIRVLTTPETQPIVRAEPRVALKYLGDYLGTDLTQSERASILINHYTFLTDRVVPDFFRQIVDGRFELWRHAVGDQLFRIYLNFSREFNGEGDLSVIFQSGNTDIYTLSFTIGPGPVAGLDADHAIYIGRVQGKGGGLALIRQATKCCSDISPTALLLAATEGIAMALEVGHIIGIGADVQISAASDPRTEGLVHAYDEFWMALGGSRLSRSMYHLSVPLPEKPIQVIKHNNRPRTVRKRAFKKSVKEHVCRTFSAIALRSRDH